MLEPKVANKVEYLCTGTLYNHNCTIITITSSPKIITSIHFIIIVHTHCLLDHSSHKSQSVILQYKFAQTIKVKYYELLFGVIFYHCTNMGIFSLHHLKGQFFFIKFYDQIDTFKLLSLNSPI